MNTNIVQIKRALISISNKEGAVEFAKKLSKLGVEIISTGGTAKAIAAANIPVIEISDFTGFPEMMDGRVKTLHPLVHAGILGLRDEHKKTADKHNIKWIDLVICNLYPFSETIAKPNVTAEEAIEDIDIGGPSMIRSAAKNVGWVAVVVDPSDYAPLLEELKTNNGLTFATRQKLQAKAFRHTAQYDSIIANYFTKEKFPENISLTYQKAYDLRYGENPHQAAAVYREPNNGGANLLNAKILQGKQLSYNNINDADGGLSTLKEFTEPCCVIVKHANPCGAATDKDITMAFKRAYQADALSAFGGIICLNRTCTQEIAEEIAKVFAEIILAPSYEPTALKIFATKKNLRVLELTNLNTSPLLIGEGQGEVRSAAPLEFKPISGGLLVQDLDIETITTADLKTVTKKQPTKKEKTDLLFAWKVLKHVKSNGILLAKNNTTVGIGMGQVSRVDAVKLAIGKAGKNATGSVLASDAFFPFRDSIDEIAKAGVKAIIQPGGSIKDQEVIIACDEHGIAMVFTGKRCFKH
ncbi:MAG: bifunctional phosphoribosylaminoimidazolecarboxamide formyltransferase/IMP cyclohydrolase [Patescibacteria group bacterium]